MFSGKFQPYISLHLDSVSQMSETFGKVDVE